jgi:hypothetical protein
MIPRFSRASGARFRVILDLADVYYPLGQVIRGIQREEAFMSTESISKTEITSSNIPERARRLAWLGPPLLFKGENAAAYDELSARVADAVKPEDIFVELWVRDFVDNEWDVLRYRRHLASLMTL